MPAPDPIAVLLGSELVSEVDARVVYELRRPLGAGGMGTAFFAMRRSPSGSSPVVVKVTSPLLVAQRGSEQAELAFKKEIIALGRLAEQVPRTPFVITLLDAGIAERPGPLGRVRIPWMALEYVHGGVDGTTLEERVTYSVQKTGCAFDPERAACVVSCLAGGLEAIHAVGVIHRDSKPPNVLACGFGVDELFKIADFGIARPEGVHGTFGGIMLGTPGYSAPEQSFADMGVVGPWTDVFGMAATMFFALTGEDYFRTRSHPEALVLAGKPERRKLLDSKTLCPELRAQPESCHVIDLALARATSAETHERPPSASLLAAAISSALRSAPASERPGRRRVDSVIPLVRTVRRIQRRVSVLHPPGDARTVRSAAWSSDGHCLAVTTRGAEFWDGTEWRLASQITVLSPEALGAVHSPRPGEWLVAGKGATLALYSGPDLVEIVLGPDPAIRFDFVAGDPRDFGLAVGQRQGEPPVLCAVVGRRWFRPVPLPSASAVNGIARLDDARWLVCGRTHGGRGFASVHAPFDWETRPVELPDTSSVLACATQPERALGLVVGRGGMTALKTAAGWNAAIVDGTPALTCAALDVLGRAWAGGTGLLLEREPEQNASWRVLWRDERISVPLVSLHADHAVVRALGADGTIIEAVPQTPT